MTSFEQHRVLVTGSAGCIGRVVAADLVAAGHRVRGFDRVESPGLDDQIVGDLTDRDAVARATAGVDRVIHLAAYPNHAPFVEVLVPANVVGLYHVVTAAVEAKVARLILASSLQVIGPRRDAPVSVSVSQPTNDYALTKLWAEELGRMTARLHPIEVIAARIGWFVRDAAEAQRLRAWPEAQAFYLARSDAARFFRLAVEKSALDLVDRYATVYVSGPGTREHPSPLDFEPGRRLIGFEPGVRWPGEAPG